LEFDFFINYETNIVKNPSAHIKKVPVLIYCYKSSKKYLSRNTIPLTSPELYQIHGTKRPTHRDAKRSTDLTYGTQSINQPKMYLFLKATVCSPFFCCCRPCTIFCEMSEFNFEPGKSAAVLFAGNYKTWIRI
jgi:hypothetical protein